MQQHYIFNEKTYPEIGVVTRYDSNLHAQLHRIAIILVVRALNKIREKKQSDIIPISFVLFVLKLYVQVSKFSVMSKTISCLGHVGREYNILLNNAVHPAMSL